MNYFLFNALEHSKDEEIKKMKHTFPCIKCIEQEIKEEVRNGFTKEMKLKASILAHKAVSTFYNEFDIVKLADDYDNVIDP